MSRRLGIDLSSDLVALADIGPSSRAAVRLHGFAILEPTADPAAFAADVRRVRRQYRFPRHAEVVAWSGDPRVQVIREAGLKVERVVGPGEALARVERMHRAEPSGTVTAVLALGSASGALAIVRDGQLLHETPLTWTVPAAAPATSGRSDLLRRYAFLSELTELLHGSFDAARRSAGACVGEILTCGTLPELRSFTMPLAEEFDLEVEALDSLEGLDVRLHGERLEHLRENIATLRLAIVAGRRWHAQRPAAARIARLAVPAGVAAGAVYAMAMYGLGQPPQRPAASERQTTIATAVRRADAPVRAAASPARPVERKPPSTAAPVRTARVETPATPSSGASRSPRRLAEAASVQTRTEPPRQPAPSPQPAAASRTPVSDPPAARPPQVASIARASAPAAPTPVAVPMAPARPSPPAAPPESSAAPEPKRLVNRERVASAEAARDARERVFEASFAVSSILWSSERQLALVDGTIIGVGDIIDGARVVEIRQDAVLARDRAGRLRRAALSRPAARTR